MVIALTANLEADALTTLHGWALVCRHDAAAHIRRIEISLLCIALRRSRPAVSSVACLSSDSFAAVCHHTAPESLPTFRQIASEAVRLREQTSHDIYETMMQWKH